MGTLLLKRSNMCCCANFGIDSSAVLSVALSLLGSKPFPRASPMLAICSTMAESPGCGGFVFISFARWLKYSRTPSAFTC